MKRFKHILLYGILTLFLIIAVGPFMLTWLTAFKAQSDLILGGPFSLPEKWRWDKFVDIWSNSGFGRYFLNSVIILVPVVIASLICSVLAGYAFAKMQFVGSHVLFYALLGGFILPVELLMIPLYDLMNDLHLIDTYWALILPQIGITPCPFVA